MSINGGSAKNSANIEQRDYKDEKSQKWIAVKQTNGRIVFLSTLDADYCIDLQAAIAANESNIQLYSKNDTLAQQWKAVKYNPIQELADQNRGAISDGEYRIKSALNEKYIISTGDGDEWLFVCLWWSLKYPHLKKTKVVLFQRENH